MSWTSKTVNFFHLRNLYIRLFQLWNNYIRTVIKTWRWQWIYILSTLFEVRNILDYKKKLWKFDLKCKNSSWEADTWKLWNWENQALKLKIRKECAMFKVRSTIFGPFTAQIHVKTSLVTDSETSVFANYDFSRKLQNFKWKTTLRGPLLSGTPLLKGRLSNSWNSLLIL